MNEKVNLPRGFSPQPENAEIMRFELAESICVSMFYAARSKGAAAILHASEVNAESLAALLAGLEDSLQRKAFSCEVKLTGHSRLVENARALLSNMGVKVKNCVGKDAARLEVLFYPGTGRLRIAVKDAFSVSAKTETVAQGPESTLTEKLKVMIVDDSATIRKLLESILNRDPSIEIVASVGKPLEVEALVAKLRPDVITLDIHMPDMDGIALLRTLMPVYKIPTVMITATGYEDGPKVLDALEAGAVDYIQKPAADSLEMVSQQILEKVKSAAKAKVFLSAPAQPAPSFCVRPVKHKSGNTLVAVGSSTGGTEALKEILVRLPENIPPMVCVQHIPAGFSLAFANRLNTLCPFEVKEAEDGDEVHADRVLIAPGGKQMRVVQKHNGMFVVIEDAAPRNRHKPSVDVLFDSVATVAGGNAIGVILTGMGADGAEGLLKMRQAGAHTIAQNEASCVVYGMPREAVKRGAAEQVLDLLKIPEEMLRILSR